MKMSSTKVDYLYDLMDAAYDAGPIYNVTGRVMRGLQSSPLTTPYGHATQDCPLIVAQGLAASDPQGKRPPFAPLGFFQPR
jgi:hypothetical protein